MKIQGTGAGAALDDGVPRDDGDGVPYGHEMDDEAAGRVAGLAWRCEAEERGPFVPASRLRAGGLAAPEIQPDITVTHAECCLSGHRMEPWVICRYPSTLGSAKA